MYSRYKRVEYDPSDEEEIADEITDEYELYKYNLPPRYDGSRFSRRTVTQKMDETKSSPAECSSNAKDTCLQTDEDEECTKIPMPILPHLSSRGYEDILIICLILLITEKEDSTGDVILLLVLLLATK